MTLEKYRQKRKFEKTPEPKGKVLKSGKYRFVVHDHFAEKAGHHHDFRLEMDGVLRSWAVPNGVPEKIGMKRLAIQTEDHPTDYINFEGKIPEGCYGAGKVKIFDKGNYELISKTLNRIEFKLFGKKLEGNYNLVKFKKPLITKRLQGAKRPVRNQWLLFKTK